MALYGGMQLALLCCCLSNQGFELNPYDPCMANKIIDGKQFTVCWYIGNTKISHVDPLFVTWVIKNIEKQIRKMIVNQDIIN